MAKNRVNIVLEKLRERTDFFEAPASSKYHLNFSGGLVKHSFNVYKELSLLVERLKINVNQESVEICGRFHDVCKINTYQLQEDGTYTKEDSCPIGHGEKSVYILQKWIDLTDEEALAIRWHMGAYTPGIFTNKELMDQFQTARNNYKLVDALHIADMIASQIIEK